MEGFPLRPYTSVALMPFCLCASVAPGMRQNLGASVAYDASDA